MDHCIAGLLSNKIRFNCFSTDKKHPTQLKPCNESSPYCECSLVEEKALHFRSILLCSQWHSCSVTRKKSPNVYKSCPKMISLQKSYILTTLQKLPKNVRYLGKLIVAKGFKKLPEVQKFDLSGHTALMSFTRSFSVFLTLSIFLNPFIFFLILRHILSFFLFFLTNKLSPSFFLSLL